MLLTFYPRALWSSAFFWILNGMNFWTLALVGELGRLTNIWSSNFISCSCLTWRSTWSYILEFTGKLATPLLQKIESGCQFCQCRSCGIQPLLCTIAASGMNISRTDSFQRKQIGEILRPTWLLEKHNWLVSCFTSLLKLDFLEVVEDLELLLRAGSGCWFWGGVLFGKLVDSSA